jgi:hypothetical protein
VSNFILKKINNKRHSEMTGILKNTVVLSNYTEKEVFERVSEKYSVRLRRRTIWANVDSDPWLLKYVRPYFTEFKIEPELVRFHFWLNILRKQCNRNWIRNTQKLFVKETESYFHFCRTNGFNTRIDLTRIEPTASDKTNTQSGNNLLNRKKKNNNLSTKIKKEKPWNAELERIKTNLTPLSDVEE